MIIDKYNMNLNNIGSGKKLIKQLIGKIKSKDAPWSRTNQTEKIKNQKNPYNPKNKK